MKKILVILFLFIFSLPAFAEYIPIPEDKKTQYKLEVEQYIDKQVPIIKKSVNIEFKNTYKICKKQKTKNKECQKLINDFIYYIDSYEFYFYFGLIKIIKKYVDIENEIPNTDFSIFLYEFIHPYINNYDIYNIRKMNNFILYLSKKTDEIIHLKN